MSWRRPESALLQVPGVNEWGGKTGGPIKKERDLGLEQGKRSCTAGVLGLSTCHAQPGRNESYWWVWQGQPHLHRGGLCSACSDLWRKATGRLLDTCQSAQAGTELIWTLATKTQLWGWSSWHSHRHPCNKIINLQYYTDIEQHFTHWHFVMAALSSERSSAEVDGCENSALSHYVWNTQGPRPGQTYGPWPKTRTLGGSIRPDWWLILKAKKTLHVSVVLSNDISLTMKIFLYTCAFLDR